MLLLSLWIRYVSWVAEDGHLLPLCSFGWLGLFRPRFLRGLWPKIVLYSLGRLIGIFFIYFVPLELVFFSQYHYH
ncbi:unnamed protein product [Brassica oleracea]